MRKLFVNAAVLALALITVTPAFQSCKDYDDDITTINGVNDTQAQQIVDIKKQIDNLTEAQKAAQTAADNAAAAAEAARKLADDALKAGNQAEADALTAQAMASDAKAAAEQAKADALAKIAEEAEALKALIDANTESIASNAAAIAGNSAAINENAVKIAAAVASIAQNADAIAALDGRVSAIDASLANYSTTDEMVAAINKAISDNNAAVNEAIAAAISANNALVDSAIATAINNNNASINSAIDAAKADLLAQINAVAARTTAIEVQQATLSGYVETLQNNYSTLADNVSTLSATIAAQQASIAEIQGKLSEVNTAISGMNTQLSELSTKLNTVSSDVAAAKADITAIKADITSIKGDVSKLDSDLKALTSRVSAVETELNTLTTLLLPGRLSSVTMVPNLYIGGIPTIEFMTIQYNQWIAETGNNKKGLYKVTNAASEITSNDAVAHYRLNPSTVIASDIKIDELSFVSSRAVSRAAASALTVSKAEIEDGILNVWVKNNNAGKLSDDSKNEITVAALEVPIADKHLYESEKSTGASVFSEYSRVAESYITPVIKAIPSSMVEGYDLNQYDLTEFADNSNINASLSTKDFVALDVVYNGEGQDLLDIVEGQYGNPAITVDKDELTAWGLGFEFVPFGKVLSPDAVYCKMEGTVVKATNPAGGKLSDAIGKTPWIAVLLKDVANKKIIDVKYVQIKFIQDLRPVEATFTKSFELFCGNKTVKVDWNWMKDNVLSKLNATNAMTAAEFVSIYTNTVITAKTPNGDDVSADLIAVYNPATDAYSWEISSADLDMSVLKNQTFVGKVVCTDPNELFPTVTVNIELTVNISDANKPVLGNGEIYWEAAGDGLQYILAYPMNPNSASAGQVAEYNTNILQGRLSPYFKGALECALWGTYFNNSAKYTDDYVWFTTEYSDPATFTNGELPATKAALTGLSLNFWIENNEKGIAMVENQEKVLVDWKANLVGNTNADNSPVFGQCWVHVQQPLYYRQIKSLAITDNVGSTVTLDLSGSWKVTDYYNNLVVDPNNTFFEDFYVLEPIQFKVDEAYLTKTAADAAPGTANYIGTCADFRVTVDITGNTLTYTNMGAVVQQTTYLQIPVELPHRWGTLKGNICVKLNKYGN